MYSQYNAAGDIVEPSINQEPLKKGHYSSTVQSFVATPRDQTNWLRTHQRIREVAWLMTYGITFSEV